MEFFPVIAAEWKFKGHFLLLVAKVKCNQAEVVYKAGMIMILNILKRGLFDIIVITGNLFRITKETESKAEINQFVLIPMGHPLSAINAVAGVKQT